MLITEEKKTKYEKFDVKYKTTETENHLNSKKHKHLEGKQRRELKLKCILCERNVLGKIWGKHQKKLKTHSRAHT